MLLATIGAFLFAPAAALPALAGFVIITTIGWVTYQGAIARLLTLFATVLTVLTVFLITVFLFVSALPAFTEHGSGLLLLPAESG
ncbi:phosphate ABC transporter permease subunit PstC, partial [Microvirga sp. KLBC 81]